MTKERMEAFSDGVIAIIITIMVLELKVPATASLSVLAPVIPVLASYAMSFLVLGIYWSNHHHLLKAVEHVDGRVLWANLHLLFWLSLIPFTTAWMGENHFAAWPVALYGGVLVLAAIAYYLLTLVLLALHGRGSVLARAIGRDFKGKISIVIYLVGISATFVRPWVAVTLYFLVSVMWLVPDRRIERNLAR